MWKDDYRLFFNGIFCLERRHPDEGQQNSTELTPIVECGVRHERARSDDWSDDWSDSFSNEWLQTCNDER